LELVLKEIFRFYICKPW